MISCHLRDIGGYRSTVGYILLSWKITMGCIQKETGHDLICNGVGLAMLVPSMSIKDHTIVGTSIEIERMPLT